MIQNICAEKYGNKGGDEYKKIADIIHKVRTLQEKILPRFQELGVELLTDKTLEDKIYSSDASSMILIVYKAGDEKFRKNIRKIENKIVNNIQKGKNDEILFIDYNSFPNAEGIESCTETEILYLSNESRLNDTFEFENYESMMENRKQKKEKDNSYINTTI